MTSLVACHICHQRPLSSVLTFSGAVSTALFWYTTSKYNCFHFKSLYLLVGYLYVYVPVFVYM